MMHSSSGSGLCCRTSLEVCLKVNDRRVISGIIHVLISGGRWIDAPAIYGPRKTPYNRWVRWAKASVWTRAFEDLSAGGGPPAELMLDSRWAKAYRSATGGKGGGFSQRHRTLPGGGDHQAARLGLWAGSSGRLHHHTRPTRRRPDRGRPDPGPTRIRYPGRRPRLRQRCPAPPAAGTRDLARHPQRPPPQATAPLRSGTLQAQKPRRTRLLPHQGLPTRRNTIRQTRLHVLRRHCTRRHHRVVVMSFGPNPSSSKA